MNLHKIIIKEIKEKEGKNIVKINFDVAIEYLKWLSYIPEFEKIRMDELSNKRITELTPSELKELKKFGEEQKIIPIFSRYISDNCKKNDVLAIDDYVKNNKLEKIMKRKLTVEEKLQANRLIETISNNSQIELSYFINEWKKPEVYKSLSMIQSFMLHKISEIYEIRNRELEQEKIKSFYTDEFYTMNQNDKSQILVR